MIIIRSYENLKNRPIPTVHYSLQIWKGSTKTLKKVILKFSKVSFKDRNLRKAYGAKVAILSSFITLVSFCAPPPNEWQWKLGCSIVFITALVFTFLLEWYKANQTNHANLKINGTKVNICIGDLFAQDGLKIIGVNNSIDLVADDIKIAKRTLHGQFVMRFQNELAEVEEAIKTSKTLIIEGNPTESSEQSYTYGSCVLYKDYVLAVLTKFDMLNNAYTSIQEYIEFWMTFWASIDVIYNSQTINIPIMGAGQTRFRGIKPKKQELVEIALWTLKESGFCNYYTDKSINFIIHEEDASEIDFYHIQHAFD